MSEDIKSAREIALGKAASLGQATEEEHLRWQYVPEGKALAVKYLNEGQDIATQFSPCPEKARKYVIKGAEEVLLANIGLPKNDAARKKNEKAMEALMGLKNDKAETLKVFDQMRHIFNHYEEQGEQQRKQAYEEMKVQFRARLEQAVEQRLGAIEGLDINVENLPQFQEEWQRMLAKLDVQYINYLDEYKHELRAIS